MTDDDGIWRDEERLPLEDLERAMGTSSGEGQTDDVTGNDAGAEEELGHDPGTPRPSTTGRTGPH